MAEQFEREEEKTPVFVINGFLEAGKTQFLRFTMEQSYFQTEGKTLLLVCEEGEEEYPEALLKKYNTAAIYFESQEECTKGALRALGEEFHPERVLIEWNGLWRQDSLELPEEWFLNQQISIFDTSTLDLYLKNMRAYLGPMLNATELIICNRADEIPEEKLGNYHLSLKAMAPDAEIVFEGRDGEIRGDFSIELPYDLKADKLELTPEMFAIFYIDAMDRPEKYDGKEVSFTAELMRPKGAPADILIPGRKVMTCCEADIRFCGLLCHYAGARNFKTGDWVKLRAKIRKENAREYGAEGPVLYAEELSLTGPIAEVATFA